MVWYYMYALFFRILLLLLPRQVVNETNGTKGIVFPNKSIIRFATIPRKKIDDYLSREGVQEGRGWCERRQVKKWDEAGEEVGRGR